jgi:hypothetical protein
MTLLHEHTKEETNQLIAAKEEVINQTSNAFVRSGWSGPDADKWKADWYDFNQRWVDMKRKVLASFVLYGFTHGPIPDQYVRAEDEWQMVLKALAVSGTGLYTTGDLPDMTNRLRDAVGQAYTIDASKIPKQDAEDLDLQAYMVADKYAKGVEDVPGDIVDAAAKTAVRNPLAVIGTALAVGVAGYVGLKVLTKGIL